ncbi:MAG: recombinase family protein [Dethiosulfatibacter sp.]|nr:recombinase family protein [Dethiosulfatibacter sp.]
MKIKTPTPKTIMRKKVAAYARVSSGKDSMLNSLSAQVSYYSELIQQNPKWEYAGVYADEAITGTKMERGQFQKLLEECRHKRVDMIITKSISRFARNTLALLEVVRELKEINIDVYFEKENIHSISGDGELMLSILASFAQAESHSASENCKWRIRKSFAEGELVNFSFMYGYHIDKKDIAINEKEANIIRMIFADYLEGMGTVAIAKKLREMAVDRPRGGTWTSERVAELLKNEKLIGDALLQKKYVMDHLSKKLVKNRGQLPQYYVKNSHPAIIDKETFNRVQEKLAENAERFAAKERVADYGLTGVISCGMCGKNFNRKANHARVYWGCSTYLHFGKTACSMGQIPERILIELINEVLSLDEFSETDFSRNISEIVIPRPFEIWFVMRDGTQIRKPWTHKSRKDSWDRGAREKARILSLQKCKEMTYANS